MPDFKPFELIYIMIAISIKNGTRQSTPYRMTKLNKQ